MAIPQFPLAKFGTVFGALEMLRTNTVFISSPLDLNDSFEMRPKWTQEHENRNHDYRVARDKAIVGWPVFAEMTPGEFTLQGPQPPPAADHDDKFNPKMNVDDQYGIAEGYNYNVAEYIHEIYRVLSLVEKMVDTTEKYQRSHWGDVLMWSHYGDMFQGAAVLLDPEHFPNGLENPKGGRGFPIDYDDNRVALPGWIYDFVAVKDHPGSPPIFVSPEEAEELNSSMTKLLSTKAKMWEYEREIRMLYPMDMITTPGLFPEIEIPVTLDGVSTPAYRDSVTINEKAIVGVVFGPEITLHSLAQIVPILREPRHEHLKLYRSAHNGQRHVLDYLESSLEDIETFTREHTEHIAMIKDHVIFEGHTMRMLHPYGAKKTVNFNKRRPYVADVPRSWTTRNTFPSCGNGILGEVSYLMTPETTVDEVVTAYQGYRKTQDVAAAADATIEQFALTPSYLLDAFNAAHLNLDRPDEDAKVIHGQRNELLAHFRKLEKQG